MNIPLKETETTPIQSLIELCALFLNENRPKSELSNIHWESVIVLAKKHRVVNLISKVIQHHKLLIPSETVKEFTNLNRGVILKMLAFSAEIAFIYNRLKNVSIETIPLKGPIASKQIYGDFSAKNSRDIDLYVKPEHLEPTIKILEKSDYSLSYPFHALNKNQKKIFLKNTNQLSFFNHQKKIQIEIHWRLFANPHLLPISFEELIQKSATIEIGKTLVPSLSKEHLLLLLTVHGAKHHWSLLYWLLEVGSLIKKEDFDWEAVLENAISIGVERPLVQALVLCHQLFDIPLPNVISDHYQKDKVIHTLVARSKYIIYNDSSFAVKGIKNYWQILSYKMRLKKEFSYKLGNWNAISIKDFDQITFSEPFFFLYTVLRPFLWCKRYLFSSNS